MLRLAVPLLLATASCKAPVAVESYLAVVHISPNNGAINVPINTEIVATFSEGLEDQSVNDQSIYLEDLNGDVLDASLVYNDDLWTVFLAPDEDLEPGGRYEFVMATSLVGTRSGPLVQEIRVEFTTSGGTAPTNNRPIADAGEDQQVSVGDVVQLDGSGSYDPDDTGDDQEDTGSDTAITWFWEFLDLPESSSASFDDATLIDPSFTADAPGTYVVQLTVSDGQTDSSPDYVQIEAVEAD